MERQEGEGSGDRGKVGERSREREEGVGGIPSLG